MTSARQTAANRSNAASSSGPRSPEGKQKSSMNALRHGGTAALGVLPDEDPQEAVQLGQRLHDAYAPCGPDQEILVQLICDGLRRLQRLSRVESGILTWHLYEKLQDRVDEEGEDSVPMGGPSPWRTRSPSCAESRLWMSILPPKHSYTTPTAPTRSASSPATKPPSPTASWGGCRSFASCSPTRWIRHSGDRIGSGMRPLPRTEHP